MASEICSGVAPKSMKSRIARVLLRVQSGAPEWCANSSVRSPRVTRSVSIPPYSSGMPIRPKPLSIQAEVSSSLILRFSYISLISSSPA